MASLWISSVPGAWRDALASYTDVVARQGVAKLAERDRWYREELPEILRSRRRRHVTLPELVRITEWKMARGVWRARNLILVRGNDAAAVRHASTIALERVPHPTAPISALVELAGVGPATASAVAAAAEPSLYPFFDELVAGQIPGLGKVAFTLGYYARYADAIRERALGLGRDWTPEMVERALWAHVGGKAAVR